LWEEEQKYGYKVGDSTQALIDQAKQQGLVGETHKSVADQMLDLTQKIVEALDKLGGITHNDVGGAIAGLGSTSETTFKTVKDNADDAASHINDTFRDLSFKVPVNFEPGDVPTPEDAGAAAIGGLVADHAIQYLAGGGVARLLRFTPRGTDTVPAMLTPGEGIVNRTGMSLLGSDGLQGLNHGQAPTTVLNFGELRDEMKAMREDNKQLRDQLARQQRDQARQFKKAVKEAAAGI